MRLVLYTTLRNFVQPYPEWPERVLTPFVIAVCFVWLGAWIAPSQKLMTAVVLFGVWMVVLGVALGVVLFGTLPKGTQLTIQAGGLPMVLAFVGGLVGILLVKRGSVHSAGVRDVEQRAPSN